MRFTSIRTLTFAIAGIGSLVALTSNLATLAAHDEDRFRPGHLVLSRTVYAGDATTVTVGQTLPPGCVSGKVAVPLIAGGTTNVTVACSVAVADGSYPTVFNNNKADGSFGVTSPIFLDQMTPDGAVVNVLAIPPTDIVTSFSSKSELALNLADDGRSITLVGYVGGASFPTAANQLDVSNSNTPGVVDPTNPVASQYYRAVAEVDAEGRLQITDGNAYSGNNGRAAVKADGLYYLAGNDNNGGLSKTQLTTTHVGVDLVNSTGVELLFPGLAPPLPPNIDKIGDFEVTQVGFTTPDKPGKDNNFRGLTAFNQTLYVTKGSGGNGINTVYQVGSAGMLPTPSNAPGGNLLNVPITILPGFPRTLASGAAPDGTLGHPIAFPFGIWFADATTLYVTDEGDGTLVSPAVNGNVADAATLATAGLQKWVFNATTQQWQLAYTLQDGLRLGVPYSVPSGPHGEVYPSNLNPAADGLRNLTGRVNRDGTVTLWAITSTVSSNGDQGADPNQLVAITDRLRATTPHGAHFRTLRTARYGEVFRGVSFTPGTEKTACDDRRREDRECDQARDDDHDRR